MLFIPSSANTNTAATAAKHATVALQQNQLTVALHHHQQKQQCWQSPKRRQQRQFANYYHHHHRQLRYNVSDRTSCKWQLADEDTQGEELSLCKCIQIVSKSSDKLFYETMKKIDAKLKDMYVENNNSYKIPNDYCICGENPIIILKDLDKLQLESQLEFDNEICKSIELQKNEEEQQENNNKKRFQQSKINTLLIEKSNNQRKIDKNNIIIYENITSVKIRMEALTLHIDGIKNIKDLQNTNMKPIFTIECLLSNELIRNVPRYDMFHIMQFQSENFQNWYQFIRFGQDAERRIRIQYNQYDQYNNIMNCSKNLGYLHFTVWWRKPDTCFNTMLGSGLFHFNFLYNSSQLELFECISIKRRDCLVANLYCKITLISDTDIMTKQNNQIIEREIALHKQLPKLIDDNDIDINNLITDKQTNIIKDQQQQQKQQINQKNDTIDNSIKSSLNKHSIQSTIGSNQPMHSGEYEYEYEYEYDRNEIW